MPVVPMALPQNSLTEGSANALARFPAHAPQHGQPVCLHRDCLVIGLLGYLWVQVEEQQSGFAYHRPSDMKLLSPTGWPSMLLF